MAATQPVIFKPLKLIFTPPSANKTTKSEDSTVYQEKLRPVVQIFTRLPADKVPKTTLSEKSSETKSSLLLADQNVSSPTPTRDERPKAPLVVDSPAYSNLTGDDQPEASGMGRRSEVGGRSLADDYSGDHDSYGVAEHLSTRSLKPSCNHSRFPNRSYIPSSNRSAESLYSVEYHSDGWQELASSSFDFDNENEQVEESDGEGYESDDEDEITRREFSIISPVPTRPEKVNPAWMKE